jgi:hypothetical protein
MATKIYSHAPRGGHLYRDPYWGSPTVAWNDCQAAAYSAKVKFLESLSPWERFEKVDDSGETIGGRQCRT